MIGAYLQKFGDSTVPYMTADPSLNVLILGITAASLPLFYNREAFSRVENIKKNIGYSEAVLSITAVASLYLALQGEFRQDIVENFSWLILGVTLLDGFRRQIKKLKD